MGQGASKEAPKQVNVTETTTSTLEPNFTASTLIGKVPLKVQFTDTSTANSKTITLTEHGFGDKKDVKRDETTKTFVSGNDWKPDDFSWDFGDGIGMNAQNPIHVYEKPGKYQVTFTARKKGFVTNPAKTMVIEVQEDVTAEQVKEAQKEMIMEQVKEAQQDISTPGLSQKVTGQDLPKGNDFCKFINNPEFYEKLRDCAIRQQVYENELKKNQAFSEKVLVPIVEGEGESILVEGFSLRNNNFQLWLILLLIVLCVLGYMYL